MTNSQNGVITSDKIITTITTHLASEGEDPVAWFSGHGFAPSVSKKWIREDRPMPGNVVLWVLEELGIAGRFFPSYILEEVNVPVPAYLMKVGQDGMECGNCSSPVKGLETIGKRLNPALPYCSPACYGYLMKKESEARIKAALLEAKKEGKFKGIQTVPYATLNGWRKKGGYRNGTFLLSFVVEAGIPHLFFNYRATKRPPRPRKQAKGAHHDPIPALATLNLTEEDGTLVGHLNADFRANLEKTYQTFGEEGLHEVLMTLNKGIAEVMVLTQEVRNRRIRDKSDQKAIEKTRQINKKATALESLYPKKK